jgi:L-threonylcarbamoyladenylate synthase
VSEVNRAIDVLRAGGLVAIPTETVYGLAADASNPDAVRRIFEVKRRPADHPLIVHIAGAEQLGEWAATTPPSAAILSEACWPGPLTLLLPRAERVLDVVTGGRSTVGLRVPAHRLTLELLQRFGGGLAAPSANRFGRVSPTTADHVRADLGADVDFVLDGGSCPIGVESTIVDCTVDPPQVLRPGAISADEIESLLDMTLGAATGPSRASGMLDSHYAPRCRVLLADTTADAKVLAAASPNVEIIEDHDLAHYAHTLFSRLRDADNRGIETVIAVLPPTTGLGHAIRDRLAKAAAPSRER